MLLPLYTFLLPTSHVTPFLFSRIFLCSSPLLNLIRIGKRKGAFSLTCQTFRPWLFVSPVLVHTKAACETWSDTYLVNCSGQLQRGPSACIASAAPFYIPNEHSQTPRAAPPSPAAVKAAAARQSLSSKVIFVPVRPWRSSLGPNTPYVASTAGASNADSIRHERTASEMSEKAEATPLRLVAREN